MKVPKLGKAARRELVLVTPDLFERGGGIARIARATALACHQHCAEHGAELSVLSLNDGGDVFDERYLPPGSRFVGFGGSRSRLVQELVARAWRRGHAGTIFCHVNFAVVGSLFPGRSKRYSVVAHGVDVWERLSLTRRIALRRAAEVWPVSDYTARVVCRLHGVHPHRTRVIQNCLDPFWPVSSLAHGPESRFALAVSRLSASDRYKGLEVTIRAFARLPPSLGPVELWVAGDGSDRSRLEALASATGAGDRVKFLGQVSDDRLRELYAACAFFVLPSSKEGFGLVYLEAMAAGRAVLAADATAVPEVVTDGVTGRLLGADDESGLALVMASFFSDPALASRYGEAGRKQAATKFGYQRYRRDISAAISEIFGIGSKALVNQSPADAG